jgi:hypothetical protein
MWNVTLFQKQLAIEGAKGDISNHERRGAMVVSIWSDGGRIYYINTYESL